MGRNIVAVLAVVILLVSACSSSESLAELELFSPSEAEFRCDGPIDVLGELPVDDLAVIEIDGVAAFAAQTDGPWIPERHGDSDQSFVKTPLFVRSNSPFQLRLSDDSTGLAQMVWGTTDEDVRGSSIMVDGCPDPVGDDSWLVYPGGFWVLQPVCVRVEVLSGSELERSARVEFAIGEGASCSEGQ